jgi:hypothetical protein
MYALSLRKSLQISELVFHRLKTYVRLECCPCRIKSFN